MCRVDHQTSHRRLGFCTDEAAADGFQSPYRPRRQSPSGVRVPSAPPRGRASFCLASSLSPGAAGDGHVQQQEDPASSASTYSPAAVAAAVVRTIHAPSHTMARPRITPPVR